MMEVIRNFSEVCKTDTSLRPYQQKAKAEIFGVWDEVDNVMLQMPTGTGKTRLFTSIIKDIKAFCVAHRIYASILIIAHRTELIQQIFQNLKRYEITPNVIASGKRKIDPIVNVYLASIQTLTHHANKNLAKKIKAKFIIIDEAHHALAATYKKLWKLYPDSKKLGVTATPWRMNHCGFIDLFDKLILSMPIKQFIEQGYLSTYKYYSIKSDSNVQQAINKLEFDKFGDYKESSMEEEMDTGNIRAQLLSSYQTYAMGKKGIVYAINIVHAKHICEEYKKIGLTAVSIDSKTPASERDSMVKRFKGGEIDVIVNVDIFSEGFDCPDIEFIQLARPTRSLVKYLQQVGRGLRKVEGKESCIILDNVGMYVRFGLPDANRHWKQHFAGHEISEAPSLKGNGNGFSREVDMTEGEEDMVLIQEVERADEPTVPSAINDFFPIWGITLGKTTWKEAKEKGYAVKIHDGGPSRVLRAQNVAFWDDEGVGYFTNILWNNGDADFPLSWKDKGFSWDNSYEYWIKVFRKQGFAIDIKEKPVAEKYQGQMILAAYCVALSPDGKLKFGLDFGCKDHGNLTTSPHTLFSISIVCDGMHTKEIEKFDPVTVLQALGYKNPDFVFWQQPFRKIYECYIEDDAHYVINELSINEDQHNISRTRIGEIPLVGFMGFKLMRHSLSNLVSIIHHGGNNSEFHFDALANDKSIKDKGYNYFGANLEPSNHITLQEEGAGVAIDDISIVKAKYSIEQTGANWAIYRKTSKGISKLTQLSCKSDFIAYLRKCELEYTRSRDKQKVLNFYIYRTDKESIYVKTKEQDTDFIYRFNLKGKRTKRILMSNFQDIWSATFDGRNQLSKNSWFETENDKRNENIIKAIARTRKPINEEKAKTISLSVRQATFMKIEEGKKNTVSRAMTDDIMAKMFFKYNGKFELNRIITAYIPSFGKVIEDNCPFVPIQYQFIKIRTQGLQRTIVKKINNITVKKSYDVNDKYNWVISYTME